MEVHDHFVEAVNELGGPFAEATPKNIMKLMDNEDITSGHIKSHLQVTKEAEQKENVEAEEIARQEMQADAAARIELQMKEGKEHLDLNFPAAAPDQDSRNREPKSSGSKNA
ncbi:hypothetical protein A4A49_16853 [Nicotiana attenuata]|uniref:Uncharacterized protein n=1 Tax=Nicotiana attenuata TaxID=49451 RepID=A0A1J6IB16_NICAT|nr:hypothetical protein A4A49_16853 [Nicotiana attenuata]